MAEYLGRQVSYGIGKETTAGTAVSAEYWVRHLSASALDEQDVVDNESATGVVESVNDSDIVRQWGEVDLEAKVQDQSFGLVLLGTFGTVSSDTNDDASGNVYDHTYSIQNSVTPTSLTVVKKSSVEDLAFALGRVSSFELNITTSDYARFSVNMMTKPSASASSTVAYVSENEFTSKHATVKIAANSAGLSGASAIAVESATLTIDKAVEAYYASGSVAPTEIHSGRVMVTGEITILHENSTYEDYFTGNTTRAMSIALTNSDVTIGTSANPSVTFTLPKIKITGRSRDESLDGIVKETLTFTGYYDGTDTVTAVLTNTVDAY